MDNQELSNEYMYWFFAHHFKYTPEQVDRLPFDRMIYFMELEQEWIKLLNMSNNSLK